MYVMFNPEVKVRSTNLNICQQVTQFKLETHRIRHIETQEPITDWDFLKEDQLVFAYFDNQDFEGFGGIDQADPFLRAKIIILEDHFEISKTDYVNDNIYIQWRCDNSNHQNCKDIKYDPGYCPTGCSFAPLSNISKMKFGLGTKQKNQIRCCDCENTECSHSVTPDDFYKLQLHQIIVGLWPGPHNFSYQGRIVKMVRVNSFPSKSERESLESVQANETPNKHSINEKFLAFDDYGSVYVN